MHTRIDLKSILLIGRHTFVFVTEFPDVRVGVVYPCLSSSSDDHHLSHSCLGTGMRFGTQNKFCHVLDSFLILVGVLVGAVSRYCHF